MSLEFFVAYYNYFVVVLILVLGLWAMIAKTNLIKKCIGMAIFQTGIILFYISMGVKRGATIPILEHHGDHGKGHDVASAAAHHAIDAAHYANPLTQILMLTAIVVGVATLGLALTLAQKVYKEHGSLEETEIREKLAK